MRNVLLTFLTVILLTLAGFASAHGVGLTYSAVSTEGRYIDIDYSEASLEAGRTGRFEFKLFSDEARTTPVAFTDLWVRVMQDSEDGKEEMLFAGGIAHLESGGAGFTFSFPRGGDYSLHVRYRDAGADVSSEGLAEAGFALTVAPAADEIVFDYRSREFAVGMGIGATFLLGLGSLLWTRSRSKAAL